MTTKSIEEILPPKPQVRPRIYAYSIDDEAHKGQLKVGQSTRDVKKRIAEQLKTAAIENYRIELDESAEREDGSIITDHEVRAALVAMGCENTTLEWMRCTVKEVRAAIIALRKRHVVTLARDQDFPMRAEQQEAVNKTLAYFKSVWADDKNATPRFLWNAKMRFGKTFTTYQLAKKLGAKRILIVTFKPAVEDAWQTDLESHIDFEGWQYLSRSSGRDPRQVEKDKPLVYFGSFQDLLGRDALGNIKANNELVHTINWDLVVFDEYHFGAWRETARELFEGEEESVKKKAESAEYVNVLEQVNENLSELSRDYLPITTRAYLYLSGTPFRSMAEGEFIEEQIFYWTYTDEQRAKDEFAKHHPINGNGKRNPYASLPQMWLMTYRMPEELLAIASGGEFDEFDLNAFFEAEYGTKKDGSQAQFKHKDDVQKWLDIIRGQNLPNSYEHLKTGTRPPFPYSNSELLLYLQHSFWLLPNVASCYAMRNLLRERHNTFWRQYEVTVAAGAQAGIGLDALPPVRKAIGSGFDTKTITLSCGKLTTGVTIAQWSSILMLRNLKSPETYFQAAFRVQSPWSIKNPNGDNPNEEEIVKPVCFVFDFAPTRALQRLSDYGMRLAPGENAEAAVRDLVNYLPVLAYDGSVMEQIDAGKIIDIAMSGTTGTLLARKWESPALVNVDNGTLRRILENEEAMKAVERIEGWRELGEHIIETIINKSEKIKDLKGKGKDRDLSPKEKKELTAEEKEFKNKRKEVQKKLIKFATRIPPFMYLTDFRENTLQDVITKIEPDLFRTVTGLTVADFHLLVKLRVFNTENMNQAVFAFRRYEDASLRYTGIETHQGLTQYGGYDTVVAKETIIADTVSPWLKDALKRLDAAVNTRVKNPDPDEVEVADSAVVRVKEFFHQLDDYFGPESTIPTPYVGVSYNGHIVVGWIARSNRVDLEFYGNGTIQAIALINNIQERLTSDDPASVASRVRNLT